MAKINFDTSKRLDITCRRGDSFELELTLKDSSGIPINLYGAGGESTFEMLISAPLSGGSSINAPYVLASTDNLLQYLLYQTTGAVSIFVALTDDETSTTADTTDAAYVAETAASGVVKFSMSQTDMQVSSLLPAYQIAEHFVYDIKYINPNTNIDSEPEGKTILFGSFTLKGDGSRTLS